MPLHRCPTCGTERHLSDRVIGQKFRCSVCRAKIKYHDDGRMELLEAGQRPAGAAEAAGSRDQSGTSVGHYRLHRRIGSGGYSDVYLGEHETLKRKVAVKLLAPELAPTPERRAKMAQEAAALARVEHANIVRVHDFGVHGDIPYLVMEFVDGATLTERIRAEGPLGNEAFVELARDLLRGLDAIHGAGLLHRDIKPGNILISADGRAKLADFGIAMEIPEAPGPRASHFDGTPSFVAPEVAAGQTPDLRSDLYSVGATLYQAATGRLPFEGSSTKEILQRQLHQPLLPPRTFAPRLPPSLDGFILTLMSRERERRPASTADAMKILGVADPAPILAGDKKRILVVDKRSRTAVALLTLVAAAAVAAAFVTLRMQRPASAPDVAQKQAPEQPLPSPKPKKSKPPEAPPVTPATPSVLLLQNGGYLKGVVDFDGSRYTFLKDDMRYTLPKAEVARWYRTSEELAEAPESLLRLARDGYERAKVEEQPQNRTALLREAGKQTRQARDGFALARKHFPGEADQWLDERATWTTELLRLLQELEPPVVAEAPPPPVPVPLPPPEARVPVPEPPKGRPIRSLPPPIREGILWLARHQQADGRWTLSGTPALCNRHATFADGGPCLPHPGHADYDAGVSALALLAILGAGIGIEDQDAYEGVNLGETVRTGVRALVRAQDVAGALGPGGTKPTYAHFVATAVLAEAHRSLSSAFDPVERAQLRKALQEAVEYAAAAQNPGKGWRYGVRPGDNDSSVTAFAILALEACRRSGIGVKDALLQGGFAWLDEATEPSFPRTGYTHRGTAKVYVPGLNEQFEHHESLSAAAEVCRLTVSGRAKPETTPRVTAMLLRDKPAWNANAIDLYYWYYGTRALKAGGLPAEWTAWKTEVTNALTKNQNPRSRGCRGGSWEPVDRWSGEGGRIYVTSMAVLTLHYALLPRPFAFPNAGTPPAPAVGGPPPLWEFVLKSGGVMKVLSYEEAGEKYFLKLAVGTVAVAKAEVLKIIKLGEPPQR